VTTYNEDGYVLQALQDGASGFLLKASAPGLLVQAVRAALAGNALISPEVTTRLLEWLGARHVAREPVPALTARERDVARLLARGLSNDEIGAELFISPGTVKTHVAHLSTKLGNVNRVGIAAWAWESGLVTNVIRRSTPGRMPAAAHR
jgi:DNA-binding NarL/FixJ family response regulator